MVKLSKHEKRTIRSFINIPIPNYVYESEGLQYDLMECYEIGFMFAHGLLNGIKINPAESPWGGGKSVIFERGYIELLLSIKKLSLNGKMCEYCDTYLQILDIFRLHLS